MAATADPGQEAAGGGRPGSSTCPTTRPSTPGCRRSGEVVYLAFTLGHTAAGGTVADRRRSGRSGPVPGPGAVRAAAARTRSSAGLLALILLTRARAGGRIDDDGPQVLLADADRSRWDRAMIDQGLDAVAAGGAAVHRPARTDGAAGGDRGRARPGADPWQRPTGGASSSCTASCCRWNRRRRWPSVGAWPWRSLLGRTQGLADLDEVIALGTLEKYPYAFGGARDGCSPSWAGVRRRPSTGGSRPTGRRSSRRASARISPRPPARAGPGRSVRCRLRRLRTGAIAGTPRARDGGQCYVTAVNAEGENRK